MTNTAFLQSNRVKSLIRFNEYYAFVMIAIFSLIPYLAMFAPPEFGPLFSGISYLEIYAFLFLGIFQLISYVSFATDKIPLRCTMSACFGKLYNSIKADKTGLILVVVYVLCIVSAVWAFFTCDAFDGMKFTQTRLFKGTDFRPDGIRMYTCFLVVYVFASMIKSKNLKKAVFMINIVGFMLVSLVIVQQYFGIIGSAGVKDGGKIGNYLSGIYQNLGIRYGHFYKGITGCFYNSNHAGYYITVGTMLVSGMLIFSDKLYKKIIWGALAVYSYYVIIINNTLGCYLAIIVALILTAIVFIVKDKKKNLKRIFNVLIPVILFFAVTLAFNVFEHGNSTITRDLTTFKNDVKNIAASENIANEKKAGSGRIGVWLATLDMISEKPVFGWGADNLKAEYVERGEEVDRAHNEPLEMAVSNGIPATILYYLAIAIGLVLFICNKTWFFEQTRLIPFMAVLGYLFSSLVGVFLFYTAGYFFMMLAFAVSKDKAIPENKAKLTNKNIK